MGFKIYPDIEKKLRKHKYVVGTSWRMDEIYIKIKGNWKYLYRTIDKNGETVDFLSAAKRDRKAALWFFKKTIASSATPIKINIEKSGANTAGIKDRNENKKANIEIRQSKYLNNIVDYGDRLSILKSFLIFISWSLKKGGIP